MSLARNGWVILILMAGCSHAPALRPHVVLRTAAPATASPPPAGESGSTRSAPPIERSEPTVAAGWTAPLAGFDPGAIISRFGDPRDGGSRRHEGVDIAAPRGSVVLAPAAGTVDVSGRRSLGGNVIVLRTTDGQHAFVFSHLHTRLVRSGAEVSAGQPIGTVGTTGNASGGPPHLHFEVHRPSGPIDPYPWLTGVALLRSSSDR